jgi:hypothetical protein
MTQSSNWAVPPLRRKRRRRIVRKLLVVFSTGLLALGMAGVANAAALNWSGTFVLDMSDFGSGKATGGGVATVNGSNGVVPATLPARSSTS